MGTRFSSIFSYRLTAVYSEILENYYYIRVVFISTFYFYRFDEKVDA